MPWWPSRRRAGARRAAILVPSLFRGDATGNDALAMRDVLRELEWDVRLFAENADPTVGALPASAAREFVAQPETIVLFHQSTQWDHGVQILRAARGPKIARDHNVTPAEFFAGIHPDFVRASEVGARQRAHLARDPDVHWMAASATNARELAGLGAEPRRIAVVPPFHRAEDLAALAPDEAALRRFAAGGPTALFVGRLAPNKGQRRLMRVAAAYAELFGAPLRLRLVGGSDPRWSAWLAVLERERLRLGLGDRVELCGGVSEAELKAAYLTAHVFLACSEHEGFCVPLVEAACLGVPVVAAGQAAVAETIGSAGLVLDDPTDDLLALAVRRVLLDARLRDCLIARQRALFSRRFSRARIRETFLAALEPIAGARAA